MEEDVHSIISQLFEEHAESIYRFARLSLPRHMDAKDVVQEVFLKAYRSWNTYKGVSSVRTWLYQIAKNHIYDVLRKYQSESRKERYLLENTPSTTGLGSMFEYSEIIEGLPPKFREVIVLRVIEGLSVEETAEILGCSSTAVRTRYHRARNKLQTLLNVENSPVLQGKG